MSVGNIYVEMELLVQMASTFKILGGAYQLPSIEVKTSSTPISKVGGCLFPLLLLTKQV